MSKEDFKQKFLNLMQEMTQLTKEASPEELREVKVNLLKTVEIPSSDIICRTEEEFDLRSMYRITGVIGEMPYILMFHDELSDSQIKKHRQKASADKRLFILPSIVTPSNEMPQYQFTPYAAFFTHDKKLFLFPLEGTAFSDVLFELEPSEQEDDDLDDDLDLSEDEE